MTRPMRPEDHRRRYDNTDHRREAERRRRERVKVPKRAIDAALQAVAGHSVPGTPKAHILKVLEGIHKSEWETDTRTVREFSIGRGRPEHGALRSDDHLASYEVEVPISEIDDDAVPGDTCPECGGERAVYEYNAYHHIAGNEGIECATCETALYDDEWG